MIRSKAEPKSVYMRLAIREARKNIGRMDGGPFGACIVKNGKILGLARNTVLRSDATCHAEINAIRKASRMAGGYDLSGAHIYSTTEPCPMCFGAIHWARIERIVYGTGILDVRKIGFNELLLSDAFMKKAGKSSVGIVSGFLLEECGSLLADWAKKHPGVLY